MLPHSPPTVDASTPVDAHALYLQVQRLEAQVKHLSQICTAQQRTAVPVPIDPDGGILVASPPAEPHVAPIPQQGATSKATNADYPSAPLNVIDESDDEFSDDDEPQYTRKSVIVREARRSIKKEMTQSEAEALAAAASLVQLVHRRKSARRSGIAEPDAAEAKRKRKRFRAARIVSICLKAVHVRGKRAARAVKAAAKGTAAAVEGTAVAVKDTAGVAVEGALATTAMVAETTGKGLGKGAAHATRFAAQTAELAVAAAEVTAQRTLETALLTKQFAANLAGGPLEAASSFSKLIVER